MPIIDTPRIGAIVALLGLAACQSSAAVDGAAAPRLDQHLPPNYRQQIVEAFVKTDDYANGVRDAEISSPGMGGAGPFLRKQRPTVCLRYKTGSIFRHSINKPVIHVYYFENGKIEGERALDWSAPAYGMASSLAHPKLCPEPRTYQPFPDINHEVPVARPDVGRSTGR